MKLSSKFMLSLVAVLATANLTNAMLDSMTSAFGYNTVESAPEKLCRIANFSKLPDMKTELDQPISDDHEMIEKEIAQTTEAISRVKIARTALTERLSTLKKRKKSMTTSPGASSNS